MAVERALHGEVQQHARTKLALATASSFADGLVRKRFEEQISHKPSVAVVETLKADVGRAERKGRALERQKEADGVRGQPFAALLRRQRDASSCQGDEDAQGVRCIEEEGSCAVQLASDAVCRAELIRTGVATVAAEKRAAAAELRADVAENRASAAEILIPDLELQLNSARKTAEAKEAELQAARVVATESACDAHNIASELQQLEATSSAKLRVLQRDLSTCFTNVTVLSEALPLEREKSVAAKADSDAALTQAAAAVKEDMVRAALASPHKLCPYSNDIVNAKMKSRQAGEVFTPAQAISLDKTGNIKQRGKSRSFMALVDGAKNADEVGKKQLRNRSTNLNTAVNMLSSGKSHAVALMADHDKANPKLYKLISTKLERKLSVEQTAAFCNETSGMLGAAMRRHVNGVRGACCPQS
eukprot:6013474-Pleurochrysis_carterae.AAC.4